MDADHLEVIVQVILWGNYAHVPPITCNNGSTWLIIIEHLAGGVPVALYGTMSLETMLCLLSGWVIALLAHCRKTANAY